ncbi:hypothetical protein TNIN_439501 [Trichonephila inaurata madagascariensis]|uniref:Uncharacterized protein n=1 Tax=Trichonephila inaurata madagascariensis TaxID=2747483 RepID=A0A8X7CJV8_9ARAC|nr:hypothetical protein TNIN_439501 [Trichonephila inaurata madagascariensis]
MPPISSNPPIHQRAFPFRHSSLVPGVLAPLDSRSGVAIAASVDIEKELVRWPVVREGWSKTDPKSASKSQGLIEERLLANPKQLSSL